MNRRGFFKGLAVAALCATTQVYGLASVPARRVGVLVRTNATHAEWAAEQQTEIAKHHRDLVEMLNSLPRPSEAPAAIYASPETMQKLRDYSETLT